MNEHTDALASRLTRLLNDPDLAADAVTRLLSAKAVFSHLDDALRCGEGLPTRWRPRLGGCAFEAREVTDHYDCLSEALRATGEPVTCWRALSKARDRWALLKAALTSLSFGWRNILGEAGVSGSIEPLYLPGGILLMVVLVTAVLHRMRAGELRAAFGESTRTIFGAGFVLIFTIPMVRILINSGVNAADLVSMPVAMAQFVADGIASLEQLHEHVSPADMAAAVRDISAARTIYVLGHRRSFPVAYYLAYALTQLELRTQLLDSVGGMLRDPAQLIGAKDALIVVSFKNYTPEVIEVAQGCHARKVPVIAITDNALSPLARHAKVCFQIEEKTSNPFRMLVAPMCLAQALVVALGESIG